MYLKSCRNEDSVSRKSSSFGTTPRKTDESQYGITIYEDGRAVDPSIDGRFKDSMPCLKNMTGIWYDGNFTSKDVSAILDQLGHCWESFIARSLA